MPHWSIGPVGPFCAHALCIQCVTLMRMAAKKADQISKSLNLRIDQLCADLCAAGMSQSDAAAKIEELTGVKLSQSAIARRLGKSRHGAAPAQMKTGKPRKPKALSGEVVSGDVGPRDIPRVELDWRGMNPKEGVAKGFMVQVEAAEWFKMCARSAASEEIKAHYYGLAAHAGRGVVQSYDMVKDLDGDAAMSEMREQMGSVLAELARGLNSEVRGDA